MKLEEVVSKAWEVWRKKAREHGYDRMRKFVKYLGSEALASFSAINTSERELFNTIIVITEEPVLGLTRITAGSAYVPVYYLLGERRERTYKGEEYVLIKMKGYFASSITASNVDNLLSWVRNLAFRGIDSPMDLAIIWGEPPVPFPRFFTDPLQAYDEREVYFMLKFLTFAS